MAAPAEAFVGRLHELETLRGTLDQAFGGRGEIVMARHWQSPDRAGDGPPRRGAWALVLWGRCHEEAGRSAGIGKLIGTATRVGDREESTRLHTT
jgi:hypothetical protein